MSVKKYLPFTWEAKRFTQAIEKRFFGRSLARDKFARGGALRAEVQEFTGKAFQDPDTIGAKPSFAFGAAEDGRKILMVQASGGAVIEEGDENRVHFGDIGNGNVDLGELDFEIDTTEGEQITRLKDAFGDSLLVDEGPVGGAEVLDGKTDLGCLDLTVKTGDAGIRYLDIVFGDPANTVEPRSEVNDAPRFRPRLHCQNGHRIPLA